MKSPVSWHCLENAVAENAVLFLPGKLCFNNKLSFKVIQEISLNDRLKGDF